MQSKTNRKQNNTPGSYSLKSKPGEGHISALQVRIARLFFVPSGPGISRTSPSEISLQFQRDRTTSGSYQNIYCTRCRSKWTLKPSAGIDQILSPVWNNRFLKLLCIWIADAYITFSPVTSRMIGKTRA